MRAEILSVGTELLLGQIVDTNAPLLAAAISELGISVYRRLTIGDNHDRLLAAMQAALAENDIVFTIGGLGPTIDDITRETLAEALGDPLRLDEAIAERLRGFFTARSMRMTESQMRQAMVPVRGRPIANPNGTAPGLFFEAGGKLGICMPGPPNEFIPMLRNEVIPLLRERCGTRTIRSRTLRICDMGESWVEERLRDLMTGSNPTVAPYAKLGEVHVRVSALADSLDEAEGMIAPVVAEIEDRLGKHVYAYDDEPLEQAVVRLLRQHGRTLSLAESCTGGGIAARITDIAGSSAALLGGAVTYSNASKSDLVGVPAELIARHGAVSAEVASAMASGALARFGSDVAIGVTGIAGPDGGTDEKPVGLVYVALAAADGVAVQRGQYLGGRADVRRRASQTALVMVRDWLLRTASAPSTDG